MMRSGPKKREDAQAGLTLLEALVAILILGLGIGLFQKLYGSSWNTFKVNATLMRAGQIMEQHVEAMRIHIASDPEANWPPKDTSWSEAGISLRRSVSRVKSPRDKLDLANVRQVDLVGLWGILNRDTLKVTTYVSKRF